MPDRTHRAARRALLSMVLLLAGSLAALGFGELLVRLVAPQQLILLRPDIWQPVDSVGWAHRPLIHTQVNTGDRTVTFATDRDGFRVASSGRPSGKHRVLLLGDSFVAAMQLEHELGLAGLIEQCFEARTGQTIAVWNAGVSGWDPPQYYVQARRALADKSFDLVLVAVFLGNDIVPRRFVLPPREPEPRRTFRIPRKVTWAELTDAVLAPINDGWETRSHLFVLLRSRFRVVLMRLGLTALEVPSELRRSEADSPRWGVTADILAEIDSMAAATGVPTVFALIPSIEAVEPSILQERTDAFGLDATSLDVDQPERRMSLELNRRGLTVVSLVASLREARSRGVVLYGRADPHPSADGHRVMWNTIAPMLAGRLGLPYEGPAGSGPPCDAP